ncbi:MAG: EcsC family protein [Rhodobacteraceae bacterium]|nr:EcsC family protein [Paracoccaceae bacterium]
MTLTKDDLLELERAHYLLENPGLAAKLTNFLGTPIEKGFDRLPDGAQARILKVTEGALSAALNTALTTLEDAPGKAQRTLLHQGSVVVSGGVGGAFGLSTILVELPITITLMFRSIADIARSHGESVSDPSTKTACLQVFTLGGPSTSDDASESGYITVRWALAKQVAEASQYLAASAANQSSPALVHFIRAVAQRLGVQMTQKAAAQLVPVVGAIGGATVNLLFMQHFQDMAHGHFIMRQLERKYDRDLVWGEYKRLTKAAQPQASL